MNIIPEPEVYTPIIDMGLIWRLSTPSMEDRERARERSIPGVTNAQKMMNLVLRRHGNARRIICVNDSYDQNYSIKDSERILRQKQLPIRNVFMKAEDKFRSSRDFHPLLSKSENKIHVQAFLQNEFQRTATTDTEIIYCIVGSYAKNPTMGEGLPELVCFQAEADTAMFAYSKLRSDGYTAAVVLDTEDTDNYVQAACVAQQTPGILCLKSEQKLNDGQTSV